MLSFWWQGPWGACEELHPCLDQCISESTLQRKNLRKIRPCATASLGCHSSQLDASPRWLETASRKSKLLESPGVPELEEPLEGRRKIFPNRVPRGRLVLGSILVSLSRDILEQKVSISGPSVRFLREQGLWKEENEMEKEE